MIETTSDATTCSQRANTLQRRLMKPTLPTKATRQSITQAGARAGSSFETSKGGRTSPTKERSTTTGDKTNINSTNDYSISRSTATSSGNTTISNSTRNLPMADGTIIKACSLITNGITRATTRHTLTTKTTTDIKTDATTSTATIRNKCPRHRPKSSTPISKMFISRKAHRSLFPAIRCSQLSLWDNRTPHTMDRKLIRILRLSTRSLTLYQTRPLSTSLFTSSNISNRCMRETRLRSRRSTRCTTTSRILLTQQPPRINRFTSEV